MFPFDGNIVSSRRKSGHEYMLFCQYFVSVIMGKKHFDDHSWRFRFSDFITISNEAFALLVMENNFEQWFEMATSGNWSSSNI